MFVGEPINNESTGQQQADENGSVGENYQSNGSDRQPRTRTTDRTDQPRPRSGISSEDEEVRNRLLPQSI